MANSMKHPGVGARTARAGLIAAGVLLGGTMLLDISAPSVSLAQGKKDAPKAGASDSSWVKICDKGQLKGKDKDGKEVAKDIENCMTLTEQIHPDTGMTMVGATLVQLKMDGKEKSALQITVPPGLVIPHGVGISVLPKEQWEKLQKNDKLEKAEEDALAKNVIKLNYTYCLQFGCLAETEATPEVVNLLKGGAGMLVHSVRAPGTPVSQPVPLGGFAQALTGAPTDTQKFKEARTELMKQIAERQKQLVAELKKQQDDLNKMQPNMKDGKTVEKKTK